MHRAVAAIMMLAALAGLSIAGCTQQEEQASGAAGGQASPRAELVAALRNCTKQHGFDPKAATGIPEDQLAPNELPWRQCAYDVLRAYKNPDPEIHRQIEQLILEDTAMTAAIQQGTMTRSARRLRVMDSIERIKGLEEVQMRAAESSQEKQADEVRMVVDGLRGFAH
ncbi:MAG: hypothetical protein AB7P52_15135 [Alphaproteobacteria bacterium]